MKKMIFLSILSLLCAFDLDAQNEEFLPMVCEGVKWVNEKVIVDHGDTTSYYYTYEIKGDDPVFHIYQKGVPKLCHYYTGSDIDMNNDSIISSLHEFITGSGVDCFDNNAYRKIVEENRNIIMPIFYIGFSHGQLLYAIDPYDIDNSIFTFYLYYQTEPPVLTRENFIQVESIEIEGYECFRLAYIDEEGDTCAYLVQGIGFDSRDMGDLLAPFTRLPDPEAEHQEWCGLSHVVKDGRIIYKGLRYRDGVTVGVDEARTETPARPLDPQYYNLMGQPVGTDVPLTPGIYIHQGKKICIGPMP